jgi:hypothetical protein
LGRPHFPQLFVLPRLRRQDDPVPPVSHGWPSRLVAMSPLCNGSAQKETARSFSFWHLRNLCCPLYVHGARRTESWKLNRWGIGFIGSCAIRAVMYGALNGSPLTKTTPQANRCPKSIQAQTFGACLHSPKDPPQTDNEDDECDENEDRRDRYDGRVDRFDHSKANVMMRPQRSAGAESALGP